MTSNVVLTVSEEIMSSDAVSSDEWYVDNGATRHITNRSDIFSTFELFKTPHAVTAAGREQLPALGKGTVKLVSVVNNKTLEVILEDVWCVPKVSRNLFSVLAAQDKNPGSSAFNSTSTKCSLKVGDLVVMEGSRTQRGSLYKANVHVARPPTSVAAEVNLATDSKSTLQLYHERFGHQNKQHVKSVINRELGLEIKSEDNEICEDCVYGKAHRLTFGTRQDVKHPGDLVSADVCGPFDESFNKYRYFVVFKDFYSKVRFIAFLRQKSEVVEALKDVIAKAKAEGHVIKQLLSDNGGEFTSEEVKKILRKNGITQRLTAPYTPQQNGASERENRTIVEMARTLKYANSNIEYPAAIWAELCQTAVYILNRTAKSSVECKSPIEV